MEMDKVSSVVFSVSALFIMPFWVLMALAPRWRWTERIVRSPAIVAGPLMLYAALVLPLLLTLLPAVARPSLPVIASLLGSARGATIAWMHFLALDLFVGRWIFLDGKAHGRSAWLISPLLVLTLLFAPLGLGVYLLLRGRPIDHVGRALRTVARDLWKAHRTLALVAAGALALLVTSLALGLVDGRQVVGAPVWMKPAKFAASIAITAPLLAWIVGQMQGDRRRRRVNGAGTLIAVVATLELLGITVQAARGVPSHFNNAAGADRVLFAGMGIAISLLWLAELYITLRAFRVSFGARTRTWAIRLGLVGTLAGGAIGFGMPHPTPAQLETLRAGQPTPLIGAHAVGVPDGGPGLPVTRWSTEGGDLRAPHFFGLHALQALPLAGWMLERRRRRGGPDEASARPIIGLGVGWIGLTAVALAQALRGQPLLSPDGLTVAMTALVLVVAAVIALGDGAKLALGARTPAFRR
ncbi:MAG TPA: ABA4-like family protein [Polyangia bacterium]|jgi:hypothetical protein